jgi:hypothetical protein
VRIYANFVCCCEAEKEVDSYVENGATRILKISRSALVGDFLKRETFIVFAVYPNKSWNIAQKLNML